MLTFHTNLHFPMILEKVITVSGLWRLLSWKTLRILQIPTDDKTNCLVYEREHYCWVGDLIQTENDNSVFLGNHFFSVIGDTIKETNMHYFRVTGKVSFLFFFFGQGQRQCRKRFGNYVKHWKLLSFLSLFLYCQWGEKLAICLCLGIKIYEDLCGLTNKNRWENISWAMSTHGMIHSPTFPLPNEIPGRFLFCSIKIETISQYVTSQKKKVWEMQLWGPI